MITQSVINKYRKIYKLPELEYEEQISSDFFDVHNKKHNFVIVSIYNLKNEILLIRDLNKNVGWELPGGYSRENESIEQSVNRIVMGETGLEIDELSPVAIVKNIFKCGNKKIVHTGIVFMALSRGKLKSCPENKIISYSEEMPKKIAYQNDKIFLLVKQRLKIKKLNLPFDEIDSIRDKRFSLPYFFHKYIVKHIGNASSRKIKNQLFSLVDRSPKTILDASCGDSSIINQLYIKYRPDICMGNDISWKTITLMNNRNSSIIFTNHNVLDLPYSIKFDLIIFKNTLHHIDKKDQKTLIKKLLVLTKQLIIIDVDDPQNSTFLSKLWNNYYVHLLGDQGDSFLTFNDLKQIFAHKDKTCKDLDLGTIDTVKGRYFYASVKS